MGVKDGEGDDRVVAERGDRASGKTVEEDFVNGGLQLQMRILSVVIFFIKVLFSLQFL